MSDSSLTKVYKFFLWLLAAAILIYFSFLLANIFVIVALSILLGFIFSPFVKFFEQKGFPRLSSILIVFTGFGFLVYLALSSVLPRLFYQMNQLLILLKDFSLNEELSSLENKILSVFPFFNPGVLVNKIQTFISSFFVNTLEHLTEFLTGFVSVIAVLVIVPFITFFLLKDRDVIQKAIIHIVPNKYFEMAYWILKRTTLQLGRFVRGWIFDATFVGIAIGFGFYFIGLPNSLPLGVIAGLGHLIPYFGPVIGGIPALAISIMETGDLSQFPLIFLIVALTYTLDNGFVQPMVFSKSVDMHPIAIILLIIIGGQLFGLFGMLLAVPTATVIKTFITEVYIAKKNYKIARV